MSGDFGSGAHSFTEGYDGPFEVQNNSTTNMISEQDKRRIEEQYPLDVHADELVDMLISRRVAVAEHELMLERIEELWKRNEELVDLWGEKRWHGLYDKLYRADRDHEALTPSEVMDWMDELEKK